MPTGCCVPDCNHYIVRDPCKFMRLPTNQKVRKKWLNLIRRVDLAPSSRICSCHFVDGDKRNGPSMFPYNENKLFYKHFPDPEVRTRRNKKRPIIIAENNSSTPPMDIPQPPSESPPQPSIAPLAPEESVEELKKQLASYKEQITLLRVGNTILKAELENKIESKVTKVQMSYELIKNSDKLIREYTGLPSAKEFDAIFDVIDKINITYYLNWSVQKINKRDQLLMTLMKLKLKLVHIDLAFRFGVSESTVTNVVVTFLHILHEIPVKEYMKGIPLEEVDKACLVDSEKVKCEVKYEVNCSTDDEPENI